MLASHVIRALEKRPLNLGGFMRGSQLYWWLRRLAGKSPTFEAQVSRPHRSFLCDAVMKHRPTSVFDFGCGNGANLSLILQRDPKITVAGIDPVAPEIWTARKHVDGDLSVGSDTSLYLMPSASFDVVMSDGVIFYLSPQSAKEAIWHLLRISRGVVVLSTWHGEPKKDDEAWVYDYDGIAGEIGAQVSIARYPDRAWQDARWRRYGAVVTLRSEARQITCAYQQATG